MVWKRLDNFAGAPLIIQRIKPGGKLGEPFNVQGFRSQFIKPIFQEHLLYLPIALESLKESQKVTFSEWDLSTGDFQKLYEKEYFVNTDRKTVIDYCLLIKTNQILVVELDISDSEHRQGKISLFSLFEKDPVWEVRYQFHQHFTSSFFTTKLFCATFLCSQFEFEIFLLKGNQCKSCS